MHQSQIRLGEIARGHERKAVAGWSCHEIEWRRRLEDANENRGIGQSLGRRERLIEKEMAVVEAAEIDGHRAGIDSDDARHGASSAVAPLVASRVRHITTLRRLP